MFATSLVLAPGVARGDGSPQSPPFVANRPGDPGEALAALGEWIEIARYGKVWRPRGVETDWRPYFHGSWTWTEEGWFWVSAEPWGSMTYHYGRWRFDGAFGWVWLPGKIWAPAWVVWRWSKEVIGWAPLAPEGALYSAFWTFVPASRFVGERVEVAALPAPRVPLLLLKTRAPALSADPRPRASSPYSPRARNGQERASRNSRG